MTNLDTSIELLDVDTLLFDPENPRLPSTIDGKDETAVLMWMLDDATILELMMSIGEKDYFPGEPLLVVRANDSSGKYIVIEGNRRLTAVKLLLNPDIAPIRKNSVKQASLEAIFHPKSLPALIFKQTEDILYYLGYRHITGIKTWSALAKAKYLKRLRVTISQGKPEQYRVLAKIVGSRSDVVARTLAGLAVFEEIVEKNFFGIKDLKEDNIDFSILTTALTYQNIYKFIGMDSAGDDELATLKPASLKELTSWLFEKTGDGKTKTRLGESRNLSDLNHILDPQYEKALAVFRNGRTLSEAALLTDKPIEIFQQSINNAKFLLETARDHIHMIDKFSESDTDILLEVQNISKNMNIIVKAKIANTDED